MNNVDRQRRRLALPFLALPCVLLGALFVFPFVQSISMSMTDWFGTFQTTNWVGLQNYRDLIADDLFRSAVLNTLLYFGLSLVVLFPMALFIAWALLRTKRSRSFFQLAIFAPAVLSVSVAGVLWKFIYNPNFGIINTVLEAVGLEALTRPWLGDPSTAMLGIVIAVIWHGIATWIILILAGMDRIPTELNEAASLDGASNWQVYTRVTLPLLWPVLSTLLVLWFIQSMQTFAFIYVMTNGGPYGSTEVMATYMYRMAFEGRMFAYGSAMAIVMTIIVLVISLIGSRMLRSDRFDS
ncbi:carbohydrate ABC transporter permease [Ruania zhangjianzhongii]|uniref:carbohydrate ABC transporter permease n=1 Tax=Ruania zhangjianzhongii TaxID=2603206 RepID=UPI0011C8DDC5|nr:sugar ABC transporter permease [Ruania zhangjianzhongii]